MEEVRGYVGTIGVSASSIQIILQNRTAGRYTNNNSWQFFNPTDTSMNRVSFIETINYAFGKDT
jgi:gamma-glutamyltranspeptidase